MPLATFSCDTFSVKIRIDEAVSPDIHVGMYLSALEEELAHDIDTYFIWNGLWYGFDIINESASPHPLKCDNHPSAQQCSPLHKDATEQILK